MSGDGGRYWYPTVLPYGRATEAWQRLQEAGRDEAEAVRAEFVRVLEQYHR